MDAKYTQDVGAVPWDGPCCFGEAALADGKPIAPRLQGAPICIVPPQGTAPRSSTATPLARPKHLVSISWSKKRPVN